jgi:hypothetical protein
LLLNGREQLGTVFKLQVGQDVAYLSAAHSLPVLKTKDLSLMYKCRGTVYKQKITSMETLGSVDAALIRPASPISEMPALKPGASGLGDYSITGYPYMAGLDSRLTEVVVRSSAYIFSLAEGKVFFTSPFLRPGVSGAPVMSSDGAVVGMVSGRFSEGGSYAGVGYGESVEKLLLAIAARSRADVDAGAGRLR